MCFSCRLSQSEANTFNNLSSPKVKDGLITRGGENLRRGNGTEEAQRGKDATARVLRANLRDETHTKCLMRAESRSVCLRDARVSLAAAIVSRVRYRACLF